MTDGICGFRNLSRPDQPECTSPPHPIIEPHTWETPESRHETRVERARERDPDEALIATLTTAIGRVDAGSVGGYAFRRHVAKTDLLPLVKALLSEQADEIANKCRRRAQLAERVPEGERSGVREGMVVTWLAAEQVARDVAARDHS